MYVCITILMYLKASSTNSAWSWYHCLNGTAPQYVAAHCIPISATASRQHLCSAASRQPVVPRYKNRCLLLYSGSTVILTVLVWMSGFLCSWSNDVEPTGKTSMQPCPLHHRLWTFSQDIFLFKVLISALGAFLALMCYINWCFTYLLSYCWMGCCRLGLLEWFWSS